ncbi:hypothetical protein A3C86_04185 [Candidatus Kaiserbacteria bacterium RIFCSPHIGHO2_02_FULL_49_16]|uniref:DUF1761 domain-containing protein n=1 Tax=Candidatus Kaiserbacteria bacterium RIFCSPHIGHO2_02_FULL_49_16 TaxID=1798490 RepID=A0A1F6DI80_9BACT|nr:MAG: hypothetical protein A3C86_04185 [Candidatus Kaiserbacteria bacterium RIFCSPHIGHO2_02_FULL_49_16]
MLLSNVLQILFAGIVSAGIGFIWYHPRVFGSVWMRLSEITPETAERGKKKMRVNAALALLASMLAAYVLSTFLSKLGTYDVRGAIQLGFYAWAGFVVPALSGIVLWEQKPVSLFLINAGYWLVSFVSMSIVLLYMI